MKWSEEKCAEFLRIHTQKLVDRFALMKWITGTNLVSSSDTKINFTPLGREKMTEIAQLSQSFAHAVIVKGRRFPFWSLFKAKWKTRHIVLAMPGPVMSHGEAVTLFFLAYEYSQKWQKEEKLMLEITKRLYG